MISTLARFVSTHVLRTAARGVLVLSAVPFAQTQTFVVDDTPGSGADFDSIVAAVAAVPPGAVLDVRDGAYLGFVLDRELTIVGESTAGVVVTSKVVIQGSSIGGTTVVSRANLHAGVVLRDVPETVLLDNLQFGLGQTWTGRHLRLVNATDVRLGRVVDATVFVQDSRLQASECRLRGWRPRPFQTPAESGLVIEGTSLVHLDHCTVLGACGEACPNAGGCFWSMLTAGDGGHAVELGPHATLRAVRSTLRAGFAGSDSCECQAFLAEAGDPLVVEGRAELWDSRFEVGDPGFGSPSNVVVLPGGSVEDQVPYPSLRASNAAPSIPPVVLDFSAEPGSSRRIIVGRAPVRLPIPGLTIGRLVSANRLGSLGASPIVGGRLSFPQPPWSKGVVFHGQISRTLPSGATQMSNSIAIVAP